MEIKRHNETVFIVRILIKKKKKKMKIEVNKIMKTEFLLGKAFKIAYWNRKYHSGTICKGVSNPQTIVNEISLLIQNIILQRSQDIE